jgi:hypothetical protein
MGNHGEGDQMWLSSQGDIIFGLFNFLINLDFKTRHNGRR